MEVEADLDGDFDDTVVWVCDGGCTAAIETARWWLGRRSTA